MGAFRSSNGDTFEMLREYPHDNPIRSSVLLDRAQNYLSRHDTGRSVQTRLELVLSDMFGQPSVEFVGGSQVYRLPPLQTMRQRFESYIGSEIDWGVFR
jgi:hypothetical protein